MSSRPALRMFDMSAPLAGARCGILHVGEIRRI